MWLLHAHGKNLKLELFNDESKLPQYAILSHCWLEASEEILFDDIGKDHDLSARKGWDKVDFTREQARKDGLDYAWIDTCCINKNSSAELAEAINSMYRWYKRAKVCYVFLDDLHSPSSERVLEGLLVVIDDTGASSTAVAATQDVRKIVAWDWDAFHSSKWFTRGWTLQEMLAPRHLQFYSRERDLIAPLVDLADVVSSITGVHADVLRRKRELGTYSIAQRMSWAANRQTSKVEDQAYSLLGIFAISIPIIYGEGPRAFGRLQEELLKTCLDQSIFAWSAPFDTSPPTESGFHESTKQRQQGISDLLANSPFDFRFSGDMIPIRQNEQQHRRAFELANDSIEFELPVCVVWWDMDINPRERTTRSWVALQCCLQSDRTKVVALSLNGIPGADGSFYRAGAGPRLCLLDVIEITQKSLTIEQEFGTTFEDLVITRLKVRRQVAGSDTTLPEAAATTVDCRFHDQCSYYSGRYILAQPTIRRGEPTNLWNHARQQFVLPHREEPSKLNISLMCPGTRTHRWHTGREVFIRLHEIHSGTEQHDIESIRDESPGLILSVNIIVDHTQPYGHRMIIPDRTPWTITAAHTAFAPMVLDFRRLQWITMTIEDRKLIHERFVIVGAHASPLLTSNLFFGLLRLILWVLFSMIVLPGAILVPILTIFLARRAAYLAEGGQQDTVLLSSEKVASALSLLTLPVSGYLLYDPGIYFKWRPRSWQLPALFTMTCACCAVCYSFMATFGFADSKALGTVDAYIVLALRGILGPAIWISAFILVGLSDVKKGLDWARSGKVWTLVLTLFNLLHLVPAFASALRLRYIAVPWSIEACRTLNISATAVALYEKEASRIGCSTVEYCERRAGQGRYLWTFVGLSSWELLLQSFAVYILWNVLPKSKAEAQIRTNIGKRLFDKFDELLLGTFGRLLGKLSDWYIFGTTKPVIRLSDDGSLIPTRNLPSMQLDVLRLSRE